MRAHLAEITNIIRELKEFAQMQTQLEQEVKTLKQRAIEYMQAAGVDEVLTSEGKITYREVLSKRFDSTAFKKDFLDIYEEYVKQTASMRFTIN